MARTRDLGLTPFDELFETDQSRQERQKEKIEKIPPPEEPPDGFVVG